MSAEHAPALPTDIRLVDPFERFSLLDFYQVLNAEFVDGIGLKEGERVLDLACGPGNIAALMAPRLGPLGEIYEVDLSEAAIATAKRNLVSVPVNLYFIRASSQEICTLLSGMAGRVNHIVCGNAIHNLPQKEALFTDSIHLLDSGGTFDFNTSFYVGAVTEDERELFYRPWTRRALRIAVGQMSELRAKRRQTNIVEANQKKELTPGAYTDLLISAGYKKVMIEEKSVDMPIEGFDAIVEDHEFREAALPNVPGEIATFALKTALKTFQFDTIKRRWLNVHAQNIF